MSKKLGEDVSKKKLKEVVDTYEGKIASPGMDVYTEAARTKKWIVGNHDNVEKVDYTMYDAIVHMNITGMHSVFDGRTMTIEDMMKTFYIHLYPFIKNTIEQYIIVSKELDGVYKEIMKLSKNNAKYITDNKLYFEYIDSIGKSEEYEKFKKDFLIENTLPFPKK